MLKCLILCRYLAIAKTSEILHIFLSRRLGYARSVSRNDVQPFGVLKLISGPCYPTALTAAILVGSAFVYGWCLEYHVHLAVPLVMSFLVGFSGFIIITGVSTLIV